MNSIEKFDIYKEIKNEIKFDYKGYSIEKIIAIDLILRIYIHRNYTLKSIVSFIIKKIVPHYFTTLDLKTLEKNSPSKTLFSMGIFKREDYYEIWESAKSHVKEKTSYDFSEQKSKIHFNIKNIRRAWNIINRTKKLSLLDKFWLAAKLTYYFNFIDDIEKLEPVAGKYCAFSCVHDFETIFTFYFQKKGIPTYNLQHGIFTLFKKSVPLDAILYENFVSDYQLCWGESTKDVLMEYGINANALIVAGYPRKINRPPVPEKLNNNECIVLLARFSYHHSNMKLLSILEKLSEEDDINVHLKLHPSLFSPQFLRYYEEIAEKNRWTIEPDDVTLDKLLKNKMFGWSIAVNTTAYYEAWLEYLPCLRFNDGSFDDMVDVLDDTFKSFDELKRLYQTIPFDNPGGLKSFFDEVNENLDYAIGIDTNKYDILNFHN